MHDRILGRWFEQFRSDGSTEALARLFDATAPALLRVARRIARNRADAEDAVQSTYLAAIEHAGTWDATRPIEPWLFGILVRQLGLLRRRDARVLDAALVDPPRAQDPATLAQASELHRRVEAALRELPDRDREVLLPWLAGEARPIELADRFGVGGSTLRMRLQRGLVRLRRALPAGLATGLTLSAADRRALAAMRRTVVRAATGTTAAGVVTSANVVTAAVWKLGVAAVLLAVASGAVLLLRPQRAAPIVATARPVAERTSIVDARADGGAVQDTPAAIGVADPRSPLGDGGTETDEPIVVVPGTLVERRADTFAGLEGRVVTEDGAPIEGARVRVYDDDYAGRAIAEGRSGEDGTFRIALPEVAALHAIAEKHGFARAFRSGTSATRPFAITMRPGPTLEGTVTREDGGPEPFASILLADASIQLAGPRAATANAEGRYAFDHVAGPVRWIRATSPDGTRIGCNVRDPVRRGAAVARDVVVRAPLRVTLEVTTRQERHPVTGARALVCVGQAEQDAEVASGRLEDVLPICFTAGTDPSGRAVFSGILAIEPVTVAIAAPGFAPIRRTLTRVVPGDDRVERFELESGCSVGGLARTVDGRPVSGARVYVEGGGLFGDPRVGPGALAELRPFTIEEVAHHPFGLETMTREDGSFRLDDLPALRDQCLRLDAPGHGTAYAWLDGVATGETRTGVVITVGAKVRVEGTIVAEDGPLPQGIRIWIHPASEHPDLGPEGRFSLDFVPKGRATIWIVAPGYLREHCDLEPPLPVVSRLAITLRRGLSVQGRVLDPQRRPVAGAQVIAWPADPTDAEREHSGGWITEMNLGATETGSDGRFALRGLSERKLRLVVHADGFRDSSVTPVDPGTGGLVVTLDGAR